MESRGVGAVVVIVIITIVAITLGAGGYVLLSQRNENVDIKSIENLSEIVTEDQIPDGFVKKEETIINDSEEAANQFENAKPSYWEGFGFKRGFSETWTKGEFSVSESIYVMERSEGAKKLYNDKSEGLKAWAENSDVTSSKKLSIGNSARQATVEMSVSIIWFRKGKVVGYVDIWDHNIFNENNYSSLKEDVKSLAIGLEKNIP